MSPVKLLFMRSNHTTVILTMMATVVGTRMALKVTMDTMIMIRTMATMITVKVCALTVILFYLIMNTNFQNHHPYPASAASPGDLKLLSWNATGIMSNVYRPYLGTAEC